MSEEEPLKRLAESPAAWVPSVIDKKDARHLLNKGYAAIAGWHGPHYRLKITEAGLSALEPKE